jgi:predicted short-subunit dehydrogenase-like oxidoreductase (DUF2520 family)
VPRDIKRGVKRKKSIAIIGAGRLAGALAVSLHTAGYRIEQIVARANSASLRRARKLAAEVGAVAAEAGKVEIRAEVLWFCVPDSAISDSAKSLADSDSWKGKVALHSSGALTSDEFSLLRRRGAAVASVHPLMTFVRGSRPDLAGVPFAIEGDPKAISAATKIVRDLEAKAFPIHMRHKSAYHAWGTFVSPLLTELLAASERVAGAAGIGRNEARERMLPILHQTLANYARLGASASFSGPIVRGDVATVKKHLKTLRTVPGAREIYVALAAAALRDLPSKNGKALERILKR